MVEKKLGPVAAELNRTRVIPYGVSVEKCPRFYLLFFVLNTIM